jgi:ubiquinone/menaquinone biosynthesis C-methylase UbiE
MPEAEVQARRMKGAAQPPAKASRSGPGVIDHFDRLADAYGEGGYYRRRREAVLDAIAPELQRARYILDLGCGNGRFTAELAMRAPQARLVAADFAPRMLLAARRRVPFRVALVRADALHPPLKDASQDLVLCSHVLMFVPELELSLLEIARILKPGGTLAATLGRGGMTTHLGRLIGDDKSVVVRGRRLLYRAMLWRFGDYESLRARPRRPSPATPYTHLRRYTEAFERAGLTPESVNAEFTTTRQEMVESMNSRHLGGLSPRPRALAGWILKHIVIGARDPDSVLPITERLMLGRKPL